MSSPKVYDTHGIRPIIDTRRMWKGEGTRPLFPDRADMFVYDERGQVSCVCPWSGEVRHMAFMGFEKDRKALKYRCPASAFDLHCAGRHWCDQGRRVDAYKRRTAVERVFRRVDGVFGFEHHTICGFAKMEARISLALLVNVSMALARVRQGQVERLRSLVAPLRRAALPAAQHENRVVRPFPVRCVPRSRIRPDSTPVRSKTGTSVRV